MVSSEVARAFWSEVLDPRAPVEDQRERRARRKGRRVVSRAARTSRREGAR
jgi:hypothetical protein